MTAPHPAESSARAEPSETDENIRADIERTRAALGETVQQLAAKTHLQARAQEAVRRRLHQLRHKAGQVGDQVAGRMSRAAARTPDEVSSTARTAAGHARRYRVQLTAASALIAAAMAVRTLVTRKPRR